MKVTVTGAAGMLGANLIRRLVDRGDTVRALVYGDRRSLEGLDIEQIECDVRDAAGIRNAITGSEIVYNLAAVISGADKSDPLAEDVNVNGPRNVANACLDLGVRRLVHCSSIHALSPTPDGSPIDETRPLSLHPGAFPYDQSKSRGQLQVLDAVKRGLDAVIVHPTACLGAWDYALSSSSNGLIDIYRGKYPAVPAGGFDFVDARDVCDGMIAAAERGRTGESYILSGQYFTMREITDVLAEVTGCKRPQFVIPIWVMRLLAAGASLKPRRNGRVAVLTQFTIHTITAYREVSHEKAAKELDYQPRPIAETIQHTFNWFQESGLVTPK